MFYVCKFNGSLRPLDLVVLELLRYLLNASSWILSGVSPLNYTLCVNNVLCFVMIFRALLFTLILNSTSLPDTEKIAFKNFKGFLTQKLVHFSWVDHLDFGITDYCAMLRFQTHRQKVKEMILRRWDHETMT